MKYCYIYIYIYIGYTVSRLVRLMLHFNTKIELVFLLNEDSREMVKKSFRKRAEAIVLPVTTAICQE